MANDALTTSNMAPLRASVTDMRYQQQHELEPLQVIAPGQAGGGYSAMLRSPACPVGPDYVQ
eukprot:5196914-Pleurochrysis_carterae.AAC.1